METKMPATARCARCKKVYAVKATITDGGRTIPMLVVPTKQFDSAEEAIKKAICQNCLKFRGDPERGLPKILKDFGFEDDEPQMQMLALNTPPRRRKSQHARGGRRGEKIPHSRRPTKALTHSVGSEERNRILLEKLKRELSRG